MTDPRYTVLMVKPTTHEAVRQESEHSGLKMWAIVDRAVSDYIHKNGGCD